MTYRELLEITKKHPNPFSLKHMRTTLYNLDLPESTAKGGSCAKKEPQKNPKT